MIDEFNLELHDVPIIDPHDDSEDAQRSEYGEILWQKRQRRGMTLYDCKKLCASEIIMEV